MRKRKITHLLSFSFLNFLKQDQVTIIDGGKKNGRNYSSRNQKKAEWEKLLQQSPHFRRLLAFILVKKSIGRIDMPQRKCNLAG